MNRHWDTEKKLYTNKIIRILEYSIRIIFNQSALRKIDLCEYAINIVETAYYSTTAALSSLFEISGPIMVETIILTASPIKKGTTHNINEATKPLPC